METDPESLMELLHQLNQLFAFIFLLTRKITFSFLSKCFFLVLFLAIEIISDDREIVFSTSAKPFFSMVIIISCILKHFPIYKLVLSHMITFNLHSKIRNGYPNFNGEPI